MFKSPLFNILQIFTTGTPKQKGSPYVNEIIQDTEEDSAVDEGLLHKRINMKTQDT